MYARKTYHENNIKLKTNVNQIKAAREGFCQNINLRSLGSRKVFKKYLFFLFSILLQEYGWFIKEKMLLLKSSLHTGQKFRKNGKNYQSSF